jgi:hypothetical protein
MAIACLRLVTFLPDPPLRSVPCLRSRITFATFWDAFFPYLRPLRFFAINAFLSGIWSCCPNNESAAGGRGGPEQDHVHLV